VLHAPPISFSIPYSLTLTFILTLWFYNIPSLGSIPSSPCGIWSRQSVTGAEFTPSTFVSPVNVLPLLVHIHSLYHRCRRFLEVGNTPKKITRLVCCKPPPIIQAHINSHFSCELC
jgi:hypothetical protein